MRLVSYGAMGSERAGMLVDNAIIDLPVSDMRLFLEQPDWRRQLDRIFAARSSAKAIERKSVRLGAPVPVPRKLLIAGANTKSHLAEAGPVLKDIAPPRSPMILAKATSSLCGPFDDVIHPRETRKLDYELELGVVIGKSCDTFCPTGPALVTLDEFQWGKPLRMRTEVNGQVRQDSDTSDLYFGIEKLVSYCSQAMTLFPGDIISTGSPAGVAYFMRPPGFLKPGDRVRCEIEGVGVIENTVHAEG